MVKPCSKSKSQSCVSMIAKALCVGATCPSFERAVRFLPKLKVLREKEARGIIMHTIWDFSKPPDTQRQERAKVWLAETYPAIINEIARLRGHFTEGTGRKHDRQRTD